MLRSSYRLYHIITAEIPGFFLYFQQRILYQSQMFRPRSIGLLLALVTLLVYLPATSDQFINYDDQDYITNNSVVQNGLTWAGVKWAFMGAHASNWHPLTWLSHMGDCDLFRLNPAGPHLVNILFHSANAALLFVLLFRLTKKNVAVSLRRCTVRLASVACGIRRVDCRAQGCVEHVFLRCSHC